MNITYRLTNGDTWTFARVPAATFAYVAAALGTGVGFVDVANHGDCLASANDTDLIPIVHIADIHVEVSP
jgi:hypothetical protein